MTRLLRSEWRKLATTKLAWVLVGVAIVYSVTQAVVLVAVASGLIPEAGGGEEMLADPDYVTTLLGQTGTASIFALLLGIVAMTGEFRHMTITSTFLATPRRARVLGAKVAVTAGLGALLALLTFTAVLAATVVSLLPFEHASITTSSALAVLLGATIGLALYAVLGVSIGSLITNQVAAIVITLVWVLLVEALVSLVFPDVGRWLPGGALNAAMDIGLQADLTGGMAAADLLPPWAGMLVLLGYAVVFGAIASRTTLARDIT